MRALCWHGKGDVRVDTVPDPEIKHPRAELSALAHVRDDFDRSTKVRIRVAGGARINRG